MQPPGIIRLLRGVARSVVFAGLFACAPEPEPAASDRSARSAEDAPSVVVVRAGARELRVHCALGCEHARDELTRLRDRCIDDPSSTPHQVTGPTPLVALGCCTEASHSFRQACGVEAIEGCASRWIAECESGTLAP